jgi:Zn-dependent protease
LKPPRFRQWFRPKGITAFGAPIFFHWTAIAVLAAMALIGLSNPLYALLFVASYLAIIVVHELGHACVAHRLGYRVDSIAVTAWHGWCECEAPHSEWDEVLIAWAGVGAQLLMAFPALALMVMLGDRNWGAWTPVIVILGYLNSVIAVVNLIPGDHSDGTTAWRIIPLLRAR